MAGAWVVGGNPDTAVLLPEHLVGLRAEFVLDGIAPAVKQVAAFAVASAGMTGGLGSGGAVVNDPDFAVAPATDQDLVKLRMVVNPVEMVPELLVLSGRGIGIDEADVVADDTVVILGRIVILDEVLPDMPLPDDIAAIGPGWLNFIDGVGEHETAVGGNRAHAQVGVEPGGDDIGQRFIFADDHNHIAVGENLKVVVAHVGARVQVEGPNEVAFPVVFFVATAFAAAGVEDG